VGVLSEIAMPLREPFLSSCFELLVLFPVGTSMNRFFRLVWSRRVGTYVVACEHARGRGRASGGGKAALLVSALALGAQAHGAGQAASTLPGGAQVTAGSAQISTAGSTMTVLQGTQNAAINWQSFSIGNSAQVDFVQPGASAVVLNRVVGNESSVIDGALHANGQVFLLNSNGVLISKSGTVDTQGFVASTLGLGDADFMAGKRTFAGNSSASILNLGTISAKDGGYVALLGQQVINEGVIAARLGTVALAAGERVSLNFNGNSLLGVAIDQGALAALVENRQAILADGGTVILTAQGLNAVLAASVNNTGLVQAQTIGQNQGHIYLLGDQSSATVNVSGVLDASAPNGGDGGSIETSAAHVRIADGAKISTAASAGITGTWLVDPQDFTISPGGGDITGATLSSELSVNNVTILSSSGATAGNGDIFVNDSVTWGANTTLTLNAYRNIYINQSITAHGAGGQLVLDYGQSAPGGSSDTANYYMAGNATINLQDGQNFSTTLGNDGVPIVYTVISTAAALQGINNNLSGNYALGSNVDLGSIANFTPIGNANLGPYYLSYSGNFTGLGHTISNLTVNATSNPNITEAGLFGDVYGSTIRDLKIVGASITDSQEYASVGALLGYAQSSSIFNVIVSDATIVATPAYTSSQYTSSPVGWNTGPAVGGVAGWLSDSSMKSSAAVATVTSTGYAGGLVGTDQLNLLPGSSNIDSCYSGGQVNGAVAAGGLVGRFLAGGSSITNSYSTASVTGTIASVDGADAGSLGAAGVGGLIGYLGDGGGGAYVIATSYATGPVSGPSGAAVGQIIGDMYVAPSSVTFNATYFQQPSGSSGNAIAVAYGTTVAGGLAGAAPQGFAATSADVQTTYTGFDFNNTWYMYPGNSTPLLRTLLTPLTVTAGGAATYDGVAQSGSVTYSFTPDQTHLFGALGLAGSGTNVGTYSVMPSGLYSDQLGYLITFAGGTLTINPAMLTYTANPASMTVGGAVASVGGTVAGFVNGQTLASATSGTLTWSTSAGNSSSTGSYAIDGAGLTANNGNYVFVQAPGNATALTLASASTSGGSGSSGSSSLGAAGGGSTGGSSSGSASNSPNGELGSVIASSIQPEPDSFATMTALTPVSLSTTGSAPFSTDTGQSFFTYLTPAAPAPTVSAWQAQQIQGGGAGADNQNPDVPISFVPISVTLSMTGSAPSSTDTGQSLFTSITPAGPAPTVSLSQAQQIQGGGAGADNQSQLAPISVISLSHNSPVQIVNGGVRLPPSVEQQVFVVQGK